MSNLSLGQLTSLAASVGFPDPALAAAVAMAESGGNPAAIGDTQPGVLGPSIGLWQIDMYFHKQWSQEELEDPTTNAQAAYQISSRGTNWQPWSTYNSGAYKRWYAGPSTPGGKFPMFPPVLVLVAAGAAAGWLYREQLWDWLNIGRRWIGS